MGQRLVQAVIRRSADERGNLKREQDFALERSSQKVSNEAIVDQPNAVYVHSKSWRDTLWGNLCVLQSQITRV